MPDHDGLQPTGQCGTIRKLRNSDKVIEGPEHSTTRLDVAEVDALRSCSVSGTNRYEYQMLDT
eukprot:scaffold4991_cov48-Phaeocystis_antarctica.AAC.1